MNLQNYMYFEITGWRVFWVKNWHVFHWLFYDCTIAGHLTSDQPRLVKRTVLQASTSELLRCFGVFLHARFRNLSAISLQTTRCSGCAASIAILSPRVGRTLASSIPPTLSSSTCWCAAYGWRRPNRSVSYKRRFWPPFTFRTRTWATKYPTPSNCFSTPTIRRTTFGSGVCGWLTSTARTCCGSTATQPFLPRFSRNSSPTAQRNRFNTTFNLFLYF